MCTPNPYLAPSADAVDKHRAEADAARAQVIRERLHEIIADARRERDRTNHPDVQAVYHNLANDLDTVLSNTLGLIFDWQCEAAAAAGEPAAQAELRADRAAYMEGAL